MFLDIREGGSSDNTLTPINVRRQRGCGQTRTSSVLRDVTPNGDMTGF